jgi:LysM repeat protein
MIISSKILYSILTLALMFVLAGCELAREENTVGDLNPQSLPPTLAPLGSDDSSLMEATAIPTVLSVQPTGTAAASAQGDTNPIELVAPTAQPPSIPAEPVAENNAAEANVVPEEAAPAAETTEAASIIVDAPTTEQLPEGGPVAANPPASGSNQVIPASSSGGAYVVQAGDTLFGISQLYGTTVEAIISANDLNSDVVQIGQTLNIPGSGDTPVSNDPAYDVPAAAPPVVPVDPSGSGGSYVILPSDTLFSIAQRYGTTVEAIAGANGIVYPYIIHAGQQLIIPGDGATYPASAAGGYNPNQGYPQQPAEGGYYQQPEPGYYPQQPGDGSYYQQPGQAYPQQPAEGGYYPQPSQDGYYPITPGGAGAHTVAPGETLYSIAQRYGLQAEMIAAANGLANPNQIFVGQVLFLP